MSEQRPQYLAGNSIQAKDDSANLSLYHLLLEMCAEIDTLRREVEELRWLFERNVSRETLAGIDGDIE